MTDQDWTPERIADARRLLAEVDPVLPLRVLHGGDAYDVVTDDEGDSLAKVRDGDVAALITTAVNALPSLLAAVEERDRLRAARAAIAAIPTREETLGGQRFKYVKLGEVLAVLDAALAPREGERDGE